MLSSFCICRLLFPNEGLKYVGLDEYATEASGGPIKYIYIKFYY